MNIDRIQVVEIIDTGAYPEEIKNKLKNAFELSITTAKNYYSLAIKHGVSEMEAMAGLPMATHVDFCITISYYQLSSLILKGWDSNIGGLNEMASKLDEVKHSHYGDLK